MKFALSQGRAWQGATDATVPYAVIRSDALLGCCQLTVILNNGIKRIVHCGCPLTAIFMESVFLIAFSSRCLMDYADKVTKRLRYFQIFRAVLHDSPYCFGFYALKFGLFKRFFLLPAIIYEIFMRNPNFESGTFHFLIR